MAKTKKTQIESASRPQSLDESINQKVELLAIFCEMEDLIRQKGGYTEGQIVQIILAMATSGMDPELTLGLMKMPQLNWTLEDGEVYWQHAASGEEVELIQGSLNQLH